VTEPEKAELAESCFVIQPFGSPFDKTYDIVYRPAIESVGLECVRGDSSDAPHDIMEFVWESINEASFLVCDLSDLSPNVIYELGLAHALGKPVVFVMPSGQKLPFDFQMHRTIFFDRNDPEWGSSVYSKVAAALKAAMSDPVGAVAPRFRNTKPSELPAQDELRVQIDELNMRVQKLEALNPSVIPRGLFAFRPNDPNNFSNELLYPSGAGGLNPDLYSNLISTNKPESSG